MDGDFFMGKRLRCVGIAALLAATVLTGGLLQDSRRLREELLRLHVVAASDSAEDQAVKLQVRDAILGSLQQELEKLADPREVFSYVESVLPKIEHTANEVLRQAGFSEQAKVSLTEEAFPVREYDTFSLPSGIYHSLRVIIGEGAGHNWWCVVFPGLCTGQDPEQFREKAEESGFSDSLTGSLTGEYEVRFWVLDQLGKLQNFLTKAG